MIPRYTRPEIGAVWTQQAKLETWLEVELAATEAWAAEGVVPAEVAAAARERAAFTVEAVDEREKITDHDVAAFVDVVAASVGEEGARWIHYGLTSSDVLDTALALQLRRAGAILVAGAREYRDALVDPGAGGARHALRRPHPRRPRRADHLRAAAGGLRLRGRSQLRPPRRGLRPARLRQALRRGRDLRLGAAGGRGAGDGEARAGREPVATQVIPRDRHAELTAAIALAGAGLERFATEVRNLQKTEVREVEEPFRAGQKGSSAMPHKRNPIRTERVTGLARVLRGYAQAGFEDVALWHERDISHSGAERVILPDSTILLDYMQDLATKVAAGMTLHRERMLANSSITHGALFSQRALTALVESGMTRDDAYRVVQENAQKAWDTGTEFRDLIGAAAPQLDLDAVFDYGAY